MVKRRFLIILLAVGLPVSILLLLLFLASQRSFRHGAPLEFWARLAMEGDPRGVATLRELGTNAVPELVRLLKAQDSTLHKRVWSGLPRLPREPRIMLAKRIPRPTAIETREAAARCLGLLGPGAAPAVPNLAASMLDPEGRVRWEAAAALAKIGLPAVPELSRALQAADPNVRQSAAYALGEIGETAAPAAPLLVQALADQNPGVCASAEYSLSRLGVAPVADLARVVAGPSQSGRDAALRELRRLQRSGRHVNQVLSELARSPDPGTRIIAIQAIAALHWPDPVSREALVRAENDPVQSVRAAAARAMAERESAAGSGVTPAAN
jgi:HEAT repeat protein